MMRIREAVPGDVEEMAELLYISDLANARASIYDLVFPGPGEQRLEKIGWLCLNAGRTPNHYTRFKVAEIDGRVAASLCTFTREEDRALEWLAAFREMGYGYRQMLDILWRIRPCGRVNIRFSKGVLVVGNVATFPEFRGKGAARALLDDAIERGRKRGYTEIQLSVLVGNDTAKNVYMSAGFEVREVKTSRSFEKAIGAGGYMRMALEL